MTRDLDGKDAIDRALGVMKPPPVPDDLAQRILVQATALPQEHLVDEQVEGEDEHHAASPSRNWWAGVMAIAACLTALAFFVSVQLAPAGPMNVQTAMGEQQTITLDDGSSITVNGGAHIKLPSLDTRFVELVEGEAIFNIVHDDANPFIVEVGGTRLVDKGTVFNVRMDETSMEVAVVEGLVEVELPQETHLLEPGDLASVRDERIIEQRTLEPASIGKWSDGLLVYDMAPLSKVAKDLSRLSGQAIKVDPALVSKDFSGTILIDDASPLTAQELSQLLAVTVTEAEAGWHLSPR